MDVIELLIADHNRVRGLFSRYHDADEADDTKAMSNLAERIIDELNIHMAAEEAVFYRAVKGRSEAIHEEVGEGREEHHVAKLLISEIEELKPRSDTWQAKLTVLIESVEHHVDEEEDELFPSVRSSTNKTEREALGKDFDAEKVELGSIPLSDRLALSKSELQTMARAQAIPGRSKMDHDVLAATVDVDVDE
jgi:hemerythrin superfamily protein